MKEEEGQEEDVCNSMEPGILTPLSFCLDQRQSQQKHTTLTLGSFTFFGRIGLGTPAGGLWSACSGTLPTSVPAPGKKYWETNKKGRKKDDDEDQDKRKIQQVVNKAGNDNGRSMKNHRTTNTNECKPREVSILSVAGGVRGDECVKLSEKGKKRGGDQFGLIKPWIHLADLDDLQTISEREQTPLRWFAFAYTHAKYQESFRRLEAREQNVAEMKNTKWKRQVENENNIERL